jgi:hypothetical protein
VKRPLGVPVSRGDPSLIGFHEAGRRAALWSIGQLVEESIGRNAKRMTEPRAERQGQRGSKGQFEEARLDFGMRISDCGVAGLNNSRDSTDKHGLVEGSGRKAHNRAQSREPRLSQSISRVVDWSIGENGETETREQEHSWQQAVDCKLVEGSIRGTQDHGTTGPL